MVYGSLQEIEFFIEEFENFAIAPKQFNHARHLTMAIWYLWRQPRDAATERIRAAIQRFNAHYGGDGYRDDVTLQWIDRVSVFLEIRKAAGCDDLVACTNALLAAHAQ